ncbi:MAG TPA: TonB-dependent receptor [Longimicrobiaceae bacterium]|nr:TonB-dependent receptor [Longimicrobiaceae bacterium]
MRWTTTLLCLLVFTLLPAAMSAQAGRITGTVVGGQPARPLAGAAVTVPNTALTAVTGEDGRYTLVNVPAGTRTVRASLIGFGAQTQTVTVAAGETATANFSLQSEAIALEGLVAVGYGTQRRETVTGAVSSVNMEALENIPVQSLDQMLQGTAAGVQVTQASSAPGGGISVRVRGSSSITGGSEPLYVIDGFPIEHDPEASSPGNGGRPTASVPSNPLAALNPSDIASIEVLKDASATAIYGARGANGVVIITTRQGQAGAPKVTFDMSTGVQSVANRYDLLPANELASAINEAARNQGEQAPFDQAFVNSLGAGTNWQDEIFRTAPLRSFQGTVSGGSSGVNFNRYAISGGYFDQEGVVIGSAFRRLSLRANVEQGFGERLRFGSNLSASRVNTSFVPTEGESNKRAGAVGAALQAYPFLPVQLEDGRYPYQGRDLPAVGVSYADAADLVNPVSLVLVDDRLGDTRLLGNVFGEYRLIPSLRARVAIGADYSSRFRDTYYPMTTRRGEEAGGDAIRGRAEILSYLNENTLTYEPDLGAAHQLTALAGYTWQTNENVRSGITGRGFVTDATGFNDIGAAQFPGTPSSSRQEWALQSWLGRVNYTLLDRYLFTLTGRYDGSSRFSEGRKWGFFPSVALGWRVSEEAFMDQYASAVSDLKIRGSYGVAGNPGIRPYQSLARFVPTPYSFGGTPVIGYFPVGVANRDLTWESTAQLDVGLDLELFDRVRFIADVYRKRTDDLLLEVDLPSESGFARGLVNAGAVENRGVELSLNGDVLRGDVGRGLRWNTGLTFSRNRNEVLSLGGDTEILASGISDDYKLGGTVVRVGQPIGVFVGYRTAGIVRDEAHAAQLAGVKNEVTKQKYAPGDVVYVDVNNDGIINAQDRTVIGNPHPDFNLGWQNTVSFGGFELSALVQGSFGNDVLNLNLWQLTSGSLSTNILRERYEDRWTPENPNARFPRLGVNTVRAGSTDYNDRILEDGSYVRLKAASLSYNLPANWVRQRGFSGARVYVSGSNLLTWTDYTGFDPEVSSFGIGNLNRGIDVGAYPSARSVTVGVNFTY